jgi:hypothetical protein
LDVDEHVAVENQTAHLEDAMLRRLNKRRLARQAAMLEFPSPMLFAAKEAG